MENEIEIQKLLLTNEPDGKKKPLLALQASRLLTSSGEYGQIVTLLNHNDFIEMPGGPGCEIRLYLGHALCKANRKTPESPDFDRGIELLHTVVAACECCVVGEVPNLRKQKNIKARAHAHLGWAYAQKKNKELEAQNHYQAALELEPEIRTTCRTSAHEIFCTHNRKLAGSMRAGLMEAIQTCREHALRNTEMPYACFTAGA